MKKVVMKKNTNIMERKTTMEEEVCDWDVEDGNKKVKNKTRREDELEGMLAWFLQLCFFP